MLRNGIILVLAAMLGCGAAGASVLGDVNGDGKVDVGDVVVALRAVLGTTPLTDEIRVAGDVLPNPGTDGRAVGDGILDMTDVQQLLRYVVGLLTRDQFGPPDAVAPQVFRPTAGWHNDMPVTYFDFGPASDSVTQLWTFMTADGQPVKGSHNVVDLVPGQPNYTPFWDVNVVTVPADYKPDTLRSRGQILQSGFPIKKAGVIVNCPIVPAGSVAGKLNLAMGWHDEMQVFYFDAGPAPRSASDPNKVQTSDLWAVITGMDAGGNPLFVPGQHNIINSVPTDPNYSPLWKVNLVTAPAGYVANTLRSGQEVQSSNLPISQPGLLVNCPLISF